MAFKVILSVSAEKDLEEALEYYVGISQILPKRFYNEFKTLITLLETNPYFEKKFDLIRTCKLKSFPYLIHFIVNTETKTVKIIAIAFGKQEKINFSDRTDL